MSKRKGFRLVVPVDRPPKRATPEQREAYADAEREAAKKAFEEDPALRKFPYNRRTDEFLRLDCLSRDIDPSTDRAIMISRLEADDQGKLVSGPALTKKVYADVKKFQIQPAQLHQDYRQAAPIYAQGYLTFLALPHDLNRAHLFPYLDDVSLVSMIYLCKYTYADALAVLDARAKRLFGPAATPLAITTLNWLQKYWTEVSRPRNQSGFVYIPRLHEMALHRQHFELISQSIRFYGNLETAREKHANYQLFFAAKDADQRARDTARQQRLDECNALLEKYGFPKYGTMQGDIVARTMQFRDYSHFSQGMGKKLEKLVESYVLHQKPQAASTIERKFFKSPEITSNAWRQAHLMRCLRCTTFLYPTLQDNNERTEPHWPVYLKYICNLLIASNNDNKGEFAIAGHAVTDEQVITLVKLILTLPSPPIQHSSPIQFWVWHKDKFLRELPFRRFNWPTFVQWFYTSGKPTRKFVFPTHENLVLTRASLILEKIVPAGIDWIPVYYHDE